MRTMGVSPGPRSSGAARGVGRRFARRCLGVVVLAVLASGCGSTHPAPSKAKSLTVRDQHAAQVKPASTCLPQITARGPVVRLMLGASVPYPHVRVRRGRAIEVELDEATSGAHYTLPDARPRTDVCLISSRRHDGMILASFRARHTGTVTFTATPVVPAGESGPDMIGRAQITQAAR